MYMHTYSGLVSLQREQAALRAIEEQHEREEKRREQEATKVALDRSLKLKLRRKVSRCGAWVTACSVQACIIHRPDCHNNACSSGLCGQFL